MENTALFNSEPRIQQMRLANGSCCFVIDDALVDSDRMRRFAADNRYQFRNVDFNAYPGIFLLTPDVAAELGQFFFRHIRRLFDARRTLHMHCRLSMVTLPPGSLRPYQRMCHRDNAALDPRHSIQAAILYLFEDESLGGTSFYEPGQPAEDMAHLFADASTLPGHEFDRKYDFEPAYMVGSNSYFTCIGSVPAKCNRIIFYDGYMLHSGDILAPERLSDDPLVGRLTLNAFFTSRRHLTR